MDQSRVAADFCNTICHKWTSDERKHDVSWFDVAAVVDFPSAEEFTMAEINKLSVGKVLDKLRSNDAPKRSKTMQLDEKAEKMDEEIQRLRAATRRLKSGPRSGTTGRD
jgi:hypothetical protein